VGRVKRKNRRNNLLKKVERHRYKDKKIIQTRTLIFEPYSYDEIDTVIERIQDNLSSDLLKGKKSIDVS